MVAISTNAKNVLEQNTTISTRIGCTLEYNMNQLVDNITITGNEYTAPDGTKPFKKLFPVDSVVKPFRPNGAGIKYAITGDVASGSYRDPKSTTYDIDYRTYYPGPDTYYKYFISPKSSGVDISMTYPKTIYTNKIVIRFEISHAIPPTWIVSASGSQIATGTDTSIVAFKTGSTKNYNAGTLALYYNGTSWSTTKPSAIAAPVSISSLRLQTGSVANKFIGVIEMSPRWEVDISDRIVNFEISKEASTSVSDLLPIGNVSANSLSMSLVSYEEPRIIKTYDKSSTISTSNLYLYKKVLVNPFIKLYYSGAPSTDSYGAHEVIPQGQFLIDSWSISEFGDVSLRALDSAKILQETLCPGIFCEGYSVQAIIRRLLDNVGFTNYNFNSNTTETTPLVPRFWWAEDSKTVWSAIQDLCRDAQITAVVDENNILQFYTRDYMFNSSRTENWQMRSELSGSNLPNILSLDKTDLPSANQVKVLWNSVTTSIYPSAEQSQSIWRSGKSFMAALSLDNDLTTASGEGSYINLSPVETNEYNSQILYEYSGYLVVNSEIIEYDGIEYFYYDTNNVKQLQVIQSDADYLKYQGLAKSGRDNFGRTGRYKIKQRGAFGTAVGNHYAAATSIIASWNGYQVTWV
jgi:hypothetical protein